MIDRIDGFFSKLFSYPLRFLCATTGKDNFFCAKVALWIGVSVLLFFVLGLIASGGSVNISIALLCGLAFSGIFVGIIDAVGEIQESGGGEAEAVSGEAVEDIVFYRLFLIALMFVMLPPLLAFGGWANLSIYFLIPFPYWTAGLYWATEFRPRRTSKIRQGLRWAKQHLLPPVGKPSHQPHFNAEGQLVEC